MIGSMERIRKTKRTRSTRRRRNIISGRGAGRVALLAAAVIRTRFWDTEAFLRYGFASGLAHASSLEVGRYGKIARTWVVLIATRHYLLGGK